MLNLFPLGHIQGYKFLYKNKMTLHFILYNAFYSCLKKYTYRKDIILQRNNLVKKINIEIKIVCTSFCKYIAKANNSSSIDFNILLFKEYSKQNVPLM